MQFSVLRVINEDRVAPGEGFPTHGHRDMEIVSYVLEGALEHKDSLGTGSVIRPGDVQRMSAGTGCAPQRIQRLEIRTRALPADLDSAEDERHCTRLRAEAFCAGRLSGRLRLIASPDGRDGSVTIHQDALLYATKLDSDTSVTHSLAPGRRAYIHVARGAVALNGTPLAAGDGARIEQEASLQLSNGQAAEVLVFDLP